MEISEVCDILGLYRLPKPQNVIIVGETVHEEMANGIRYYRGLTPTGKDVILLSAQATPETILHETLHDAFGLGELVTYPLARVAILKAQVLENFPRAKALVEQPVKYEKCTGCQEFALLHQEYANRAEHYRRLS